MIMRPPLKTLLFAGVAALISSQAFAQTPASPSTQRGQRPDASLATATGYEVSVTVGSYTYTEPGETAISIHGAKFGGELTGAWSLNRRRNWYAQADVRGRFGTATYTGWCAPWLITPNSSSPNGYALDLGDFSPCSESGDKDWYLETRVLVGKDFIGQSWAFSPHTGLGLRHLSNGTTGIAGFRTDDYLYVPLGVTVRTRVASSRVLGLTFEYDRLIHGWQKTRDSALGSGLVPATPSAPAFTIDGFSDISFAQHSGWALRAIATWQVTSRWSVEPYYVRWKVSASPVNYETATFTVNNVTAAEQLGAYEPLNVTNEFGVKLGFHFGGR